jgi:hypothetical protein
VADVLKAAHTKNDAIAKIERERSIQDHAAKQADVESSQHLQRTGGGLIGAARSSAPKAKPMGKKSISGPDVIDVLLSFIIARAFVYVPTGALRV